MLLFKPAQLDDELRRALKQRRENIYVSTDEKVSPYETKLNGKTTIKHGTVDDRETDSVK